MFHLLDSSPDCRVLLGLLIRWIGRDATLGDMENPS